MAGSALLGGVVLAMIEGMGVVMSRLVFSPPVELELS